MSEKYKIGRKIGSITIKSISSDKVEITCSCGKDKWIRKDSLRRISGNCTCPKHEKLIEGEKYGRLTLVRKVIDDRSFSVWLCKCECGKNTEVSASGIVSGSIISCGCSRRHIHKDIESDILEKYEKGMTCTDIAKEYGVSDFSVRRMMDRHNKKRRSNSESVRRLSLDETAFESLTRDSMYWMGFFAADGNIHGHNLKIELQKQDIDCLLKFKKFMNSGHEVRETKKGRYIAITFSSPRIVGSLVRFHITPKKSLTFDPYPYCANNADFWRGMIDGDGTIRVCKDGYFKIALCGSKACMEAFSKWVQVNSCSKGTLHKDGNIYKVMISGVPAKEIGRKLYANNPKYYLDRKAKVAQEALGLKLEDYAV